MSFIDVFNDFNPYKPKYFGEVYAQYLDGKENVATTILEIGVQTGKSTDMWASFFPNAQVYGIDNAPSETYTPKNPRIHIRFGQQEDTEFLKSVVDESGPLDLIVDDGGHRKHEQTGSLDFLLPYVKPGGFYVIEDIFTSYRAGKLYIDEDTFMRHLFELVGTISEGYANLRYGPGEQQNEHKIKSIHFYDCIVVVEKDPR